MEAGHQSLRSTRPLVVTPQLSRTDLPMQHAYTLEPGHPTPGPPNLLRPHIAVSESTGILTCFPSTTHLCLALGTDSPCADERCAGNLGFSARGPFTPFIATHVSIRTSDTSSMPHSTPSQAYRTLLYRSGVRCQDTGFSDFSKPVSIFAISSYSLRQRAHVTSSIYPKSRQYRLHTRISSALPIAMTTKRLNSALE